MNNKFNIYSFFLKVFGGIGHAMILSIFMLGPKSLTYGSVTKSTTCRPTGGISEIYHIQKADLDDTTPITWDSTNDYEISAFNFKTGKNFYKIDFTRKTANFQQTRGGNGSWTQNLIWNSEGLNSTTSEQLQVLEDTARCEKIVIVAVLENGAKATMGVRKYSEVTDNTDYAFVDVEPLDGVVDDSGTDPTADINQFGDGLTSVSGRRAHYYTGTTAALTTAGA